MIIHVKYDPPPIPDRSHDWQAWVDGDEERTTATGETVGHVLECMYYEAAYDRDADFFAAIYEAGRRAGKQEKG